MSKVTYPVSLVAPDGRECKAFGPVELNNLVAQGYMVKTVVVGPAAKPAEAPAPSKAAAADQRTK